MAEGRMQSGFSLILADLYSRSCVILKSVSPSLLRLKALPVYPVDNCAIMNYSGLLTPIE
jgi:hypothetical protein